MEGELFVFLQFKLNLMAATVHLTKMFFFFKKCE